MTLPVPLAVRLETARSDRRVTREVSGLQFRGAAPGGFASATVQLHRPLQFTPDEVAHYATLTVYDTRNGGVAWQGRVEDLGRSADTSGQVYDISAVGPSAHARDVSKSLIYVDTDASRVLVPGADSKKGTSVTDDRESEDVAGKFEHFVRGLVVASNDKAIAWYPALRSAELKLARVTVSVRSGFTTTTDWKIREWVSNAAGGPWTLIRSSDPTTGDMGAASRVVTTDWTHPMNQVSFELEYIGTGGTIGNDNTWIRWHSFVLQQIRKNAAGTDLTAASNYTSDTLNAHQVVNDLLGRMLPLFNGSNASVDSSSTYGIEQLAYPDGADAAKVLDDLMALTGTHLWEVYEQDSTGDYQFTWRAWPTTPRYEATIFDGYDSPSTASELFNEALVRWNDGRRIRTTYRTQTVTALDDAGLTRTIVVDISDEVGSSANANQAGDNALSEHANPANMGNLRIARPILDRDSGRHVMPWEIRPGYLIRVRGVAPSVDMLNQTRNGSTVMRIVGVDFDAASASASLELDAYPTAQGRQIAALKRSNETRRRR